MKPLSTFAGSAFAGVLSTLALLTGCSPADLSGNRRSQSTPVPAAAPLAAKIESKERAENLILIPRPSSKDAPLRRWTEDLMHPKLSSNRNLTLFCDVEAPALIVQFAEGFQRCKDVLAANPLQDSSTLQCSSPDKLLVSGLKNACSPKDLKQLGFLYDVADSALFVKDEGTALKYVPNPLLNANIKSGLPSLLESDSSDLFSEPTLAQWLGQSALQGAFALDLILNTEHLKTPLADEKILRDLEGLKSILLRYKKPALFATLPLELSSKSSASASSPSSSPISPGQFFVVSTTQKDPLSKAACDLVAKWLHATQILHSDEPSKAKSRHSDLNCFVHLADEQPKGPSIRITQLPLPLVTRGTPLFPIKTLDELRSVAVLQSFRVLK